MNTSNSIGNISIDNANITNSTIQDAQLASPMVYGTISLAIRTQLVFPNGKRISAERLQTLISFMEELHKKEHPEEYV